MLNYLIKTSSFKSGMKIASTWCLLFMKIKILTICYLSSICKLIKKSFPSDFFEFVCVEYKDNCEDLESEISDKLDRDPDAIIMDRGIGKEFTEIISKKFAGAKIMCLPSLEEIPNGGINDNPDVIRLSEPFSLREIRELLLNLYEKKFGQIQ